MVFCLVTDFLMCCEVFGTWIDCGFEISLTSFVMSVLVHLQTHLIKLSSESCRKQTILLLSLIILIGLTQGDRYIYTSSSID